MAEVRSNRSQALTANAAAVAEYGPPAFAGIATEEAMLPFPAGFRRLILSFHLNVPVLK
jgi:hypothetical protein